MNSLRARSVPAQLIVGTRAASASTRGHERVVPHRRTHDQQHPLRDELVERPLDRERSAHGQPEPGGVHELDLAVEPAALDEIVNGHPQERVHLPDHGGLVRGRFHHVVQDPDSHRGRHAMSFPPSSNSMISLLVSSRR